MGIDVDLGHQFEQVLVSIHRKLCHWSSRHLSLAGRALIVNQVLLATAWFTASCSMVFPRAMKRLRRLVRNFLWSGCDGLRDTRPLVAWRTIILPHDEGGLGIIDPEMQSVACYPSSLFGDFFLAMSLGSSFCILHYRDVFHCLDVWMQRALGSPRFDIFLHLR